MDASGSGSVNMPTVGWKYEYWPDENNKIKIKCDLCGLVSNGGINRHIEHLIEGYPNVKKCSKTTKEIADEILQWLSTNKKKNKIFYNA